MVGAEPVNLSELVGLLGTGLVIIAYVPQVHHLIKEHCSAGISVRAYGIWFIASVLFLIHAVSIEDLVFTMVQIANLLAIGVVLVCVRRFQKQICRTHLETRLNDLVERRRFRTTGPRPSTSL
jgi:uncharacterized protein with PQ loop repeat